MDPAPEFAAVSSTGATDRPSLFVLGWSIAWALVGIGVGFGVVVLQAGMGERPVALSDLFGPMMQHSILFAEVVGLTALSSSRLIFPYYAALPYLPRLLLQITTVGGGAFFGTVLVILMRPYYSLNLNNLRPIALMIVVNASFAVVVAIGVHTYETMKRQLERSFVELRKKEAFEREMDIAREVQEQLFPTVVPKVRGMEIAGICLPAAGVGGDYYDYLSLSDERVGLVVADVSGKGISAALLMASLQASVRNVIGPETTPREANGKLNEILYHSTTASRYATLFLGLFDGRDRTLRYSNAGHNPPMILSRSGPRKLSEGGLPLGILKGVTYLEGRQELDPGDILLLYTDGAVEATDPEGREFGLPRLLELLEHHRNGGELPSLIQTMVREVRGWTRGSAQQDDITIVLARAVEGN